MRKIQSHLTRIERAMTLAALRTHSDLPPDPREMDSPQRERDLIAEAEADRDQMRQLRKAATA